MMQKIVFTIMCSVMCACFIRESVALTVVDPYPTQAGTVVASFSGQVYEGINGATTRWPAPFSSEGSVYDYQLPLGEYTFERNLSGYYGTSSINTTSNFLLSEVCHPGPTGGGISSGVRMCTMDLPTGGFFSMTGISHAFYGAIGMQVCEGEKILGEAAFFNSNGNLTWEVNRWTWSVPSVPGFPPQSTQSILYSGSGAMDFSLMGMYADAIINDRTTAYHYVAFANAFSQDRYDAACFSSQLDFSTPNVVPEPASMILLGLGSLGMLRLKRKK